MRASVTDPTARPTSARRPGWLVDAHQDLTELWLSSKGLSVLFAFTFALGALAYLASADAAINLLDARESVGVVVKTAIGLGTLTALVVSADAISGERERGTLEALLVTPVLRRHLVVGKLLAATTMWMASLVVVLPLVLVMADGPGVVRDALAVLVVAGALVAAALTALGLAVSSLVMSNRASLAVSVTILLLLAAPSQLPAVNANTPVGSVLIKANPVSAGLTLADNLLVKQQPWSEQLPYLASPVVAAIVLTLLAIALSGRLELGDSR
jgi:ABC-2 type transport system permease protein